jgi:hypothetical protein
VLRRLRPAPALPVTGGDLARAAAPGVALFVARRAAGRA